MRNNTYTPELLQRFKRYTSTRPQFSLHADRWFLKKKSTSIRMQPLENHLTCYDQILTSNGSVWMKIGHASLSNVLFIRLEDKFFLILF